MIKFVVDNYETLVDPLVEQVKKPDVSFPDGSFVFGITSGRSYFDEPFSGCGESCFGSFMIGFRPTIKVEHEDPNIWLGIVGFQSLKELVQKSVYNSRTHRRVKKSIPEKKDAPVIIQFQGNRTNRMGKEYKKLAKRLLYSFDWKTVLTLITIEWAKQAGFSKIYIQPGEHNRYYFFYHYWTREQAQRRFNSTAVGLGFKPTRIRGKSLFVLDLK